MAIIIPHQLPLAPHPLSPLPFSADRFPIHSGPLFCFHQSAFLFPAIFSPVPFGLLPRSLCSTSSFLSVRFFVPFVLLLSFPLFRSFVPFVSLLRSLCFASSFLSVRSFVFFGPFLSFFRSALLFPSIRFLFLLFRFYEALPRSQLLSLLVLSPLLSVIFASLKSDTRLSTFETMPFNVRDHALLAPRPRPSTFKTTPFFLCLLMCLISCQLRVRFCSMLPSLRRDFCVYSR